jgi:hypothetical protein
VKEVVIGGEGFAPLFIICVDEMWLLDRRNVRIRVRPDSTCHGRRRAFGRAEYEEVRLAPLWKFCAEQTLDIAHGVNQASVSAPTIRNDRQEGEIVFS